MPTRIVLSNANPPRSPRRSPGNYDNARYDDASDAPQSNNDNNRSSYPGPDGPRSPRLSQSSPRGSKRIVNVGFSRSLFRELAVRSDDTDSSAVNNDEARLTTDDIRASPRFVGYVFSLIAASVLLVSVVQ